MIKSAFPPRRSCLDGGEDSQKKQKNAKKQQSMNIAIQFSHSGVEEIPDRLALYSRHFIPQPNASPGYYQRSWTTDQNHGRKFLQDEGKYVIPASGKETVREDLTLWCEAEWNTMARRLSQPPNVPATSVYPDWLHFFCPVPPVFTGPYGQNTDPYVFGPHFIYRNCRQNNRALRHIRFQPGDMILFGSMKSDFQSPRFMLDTVFIAGDIPAYKVGKEKKLSDIRRGCGSLITRNFEETVIKPILNGRPCPGSVCSPANFTLYFGASFQQPWKEIYSFVPIKVPGLTKSANGNKDIGYERLTFTAQDMHTLPLLSQVIDLNLNPQLGIHPRPVNPSFDTVRIWHELVNFAISRGYVLGTYFKEP